MQEGAGFLSDVCLRPHGDLYLEMTGETSPWTHHEDAARISTAFSESTASGLLRLASPRAETRLPPAAAWWREFVRHFLSALCHQPDPGAGCETPAVPLPGVGDLSDWILSAPPMRGGEYLTPDLLENQWALLDSHVRSEVSRYPEGLAAWLQQVNPLWRMVGRVTFHLAENKKNPDYPFAFMASYATRISGESRVQHLPLGRAIEEYAGAKNKRALINLLAPVERAATMSALMRELVDNLTAWSPHTEPSRLP